MEDLKTCQICGRSIKAKAGIIAHHGYKRPGDGWQTASCYGARFEPYEESRDRIPFVIDIVTKYLANQETHLKNFQESPPATFSIRQGFGSFGELKDVPKPEGFNPLKPGYDRNKPFTYENKYFNLLYEIEQTIKHARKDLETLKTRFDNWRLIVKK